MRIRLTMGVGSGFRAACIVLALAAAPALWGQEVDPDVDTATGGEADSMAAGAEPVADDQQAVDEEIRRALQAIFDRVPSLQAVEVAVEAGVVRLAGEVPDRAAAERAEEIARGREGVVYVDGEGLEPVTTEARLEEVGGRLETQIDSLLELLPLLGVALGIVVAFCLLAWLVGRLSRKRLFPRMNPFVTTMLLRLAQFTLVLLGLVVALDLLDATALVGAVVGSAGLAGLALGFAFKDIAENYLAGIILSLRQPFAKNDLILVGTHEGKVVRLTGRETILMTLDGNHVQIPNATVFREPMINYTRNPRRQFKVDVDVAAETDLSFALDTGIEVLRGMRGVIDDPAPMAMITGYGNGTVALRFLGWVDQRSADFVLVGSEALRLVKLGLEGAGVRLPSPEYRLTLAPPEAAEAAARPEAPAGAPERADDGRPETAAKAAARAAAGASQRDVSVDRTVDAQIEEERRRESQEDLLE